MNADTLIGHTLAGRFDIVSELGAGSMGTVYLAQHNVLSRRYAIKILNDRVESNPTFVDRFRREAQIASRLDHPNIVYIADFGQLEDGRFYLVMEYIEGKSLRAAMDDCAPRLMPLQRSLGLLNQTVDAVAAAHEAGVIHRDLKPENILVNEARDGAERVKVLDFGLAKLLTNEECTLLTGQGEIFGTPAYMAPEQVAGIAADSRADLYSLGVVMFELLTGRLPFVRPTVLQMMMAHESEPPPRFHAVLGEAADRIPEALETLVMSCLEKPPEARPATAREVQAVLVKALESRHSGIRRRELQRPERARSADDFGAATCIGAVDASAPSQVLLPVALDQAPEHPEEAKIWYWDQAVRLSKALARHQESLRVGSPEVAAHFLALAAIDEAITNLEIEVTVDEARRSEVEVEGREIDAQLRHAVVDLSLQRTNLLDDPAADPLRVKDLTYQITEIERRRFEQIERFEEELEGLVQKLEAAKIRLDVLLAEQGNGESQLIRQLVASKPQSCSEQVAAAFVQMETLVVLSGMLG